VQEVVSRAQSQASTAGVEIVLDGGANDPPAFVDRDLFTRAVENMLANALEHAPSGSRIRVEVTAGEEASVVATTDAREALPVLQWVEGSLVPTTPATGKRIQGLYGRGLALLCADLAAQATGARLEIDGASRACRLRLVAPVRE
jgi:signal transduction histidine kinase